MLLRQKKEKKNRPLLAGNGFSLGLKTWPVDAGHALLETTIFEIKIWI
jgi:hypothetical protein